MSVWRALAGALVRALLLFIFNPLRKHGVIDDMLFGRLMTEGTEQIVAGIITGLVVLWSCRQKINTFLIAHYSHLEDPTAPKSFIAKQVAKLSEWEKVIAAAKVDPAGPAMAKVIPLMLMAFVLSAALSLSACTDADRAKFEKGSADLFTGLQTLSDINQSFLDAKELSDQAALDNFKALEKIGSGIDTARARIRADGELDLGNKTAVLDAIDGVISGLEELQQNGVLGVKSQANRDRFAAAITLAKAGAGTVRGVVARVKKPIPASEVPLKSHAQGQLKGSQFSAPMRGDNGIAVISIGC